MTNSTLENLWELYQIDFPIKQNKEINECFKIVEDCHIELCKGFSQAQKDLLGKYQAEWNKIGAIMEKEAFIKGVQFTAGFLVEALYNE